MPIDRDLLQPSLDRELDAIIKEVKEKTGFDIVPCQGMRSFAEQNALYAQGRTRRGPKVTNARAGYSPHNFGCAVDFCLAKPVEQITASGKQTGNKTVFPDYAQIDGKIVEHPVWKALATAAQKRGFVAGYFWKHPDKPHIQVGANEFYSSGRALKLFQSKGRIAVWNEAEAQRQAALAALKTNPSSGNSDDN